MNFIIASTLLFAILTLQGSNANPFKRSCGHYHTEGHVHEHEAPNNDGFECGVSSGHKQGLSENGKEVTYYPWFALLGFGSENAHVKCAGVLIDDQHVLTSAYCAEKDPETVHFGEWDHNCVEDSHLHSCANPKQSAAVSEVTMHEIDEDSNNTESMVVTLRLVKKIQFTEFVRPICVATKENNFGDLKQLWYPQWNLQVNQLSSDSFIKKNDVKNSDGNLFVVKSGCVLPGGPLVHAVVEDSGKIQSFVVGVNKASTTVCQTEEDSSDAYNKISSYTDLIQK